MVGEARKVKKKESLRPDTALVLVGEPEAETYVWRLPGCCLRSFKKEIVGEAHDDRRLIELRCGACGQGWHVTSSLDDRVLGRFVTHGGPRVAGRVVVGGDHPAA